MTSPIGPSTIQSKIFNAIAESSKPIDDKDLDKFQELLVSLIDKYLASPPRDVVVSIKEYDRKTEHDGGKIRRYFRCLKEKTQENPNPRIVVIGDLHCDFNSFVGIFQKLSLSSYDYFEKGIFVFLGDYIDRGALPFETILLLLRIHEILDGRCILLRGNHDDIRFSNEKKKFFSPVTPAETVELFGEYLKTETIFKVKDWFDHLPYLVTIERNANKYLLVHGGIPKDSIASLVTLEDLSKRKLPLTKESSQEHNVTNFLNTMLWGDPVDAKFKKSTNETRFEFGFEQFDQFMNSWGFTHLIRGHEPKPYGYKALYKERLFTVFSSGGVRNEQSYYNDSVPYPSFMILSESGEPIHEPIFTYKISLNRSNLGPGLSQEDATTIFVDNGLKGLNNFVVSGQKVLGNNTIGDFLSPPNDLVPNDEFSISFSMPPHLLQPLNEFINLLIKNIETNRIIN